jgi:hypothetical protein
MRAARFVRAALSWRAPTGPMVRREPAKLDVTRPCQRMDVNIEVGTWRQVIARVRAILSTESRPSHYPCDRWGSRPLFRRAVGSRVVIVVAEQSLCTQDLVSFPGQLCLYETLL